MTLGMGKYAGCVALMLFASVGALAAIGDGYRTSVGTGADEIIVVVVAGRPYDMGYDLGRLVRSEAQALGVSHLAYAQSLDPVRFGNANLDAAWDSVLPYMDQRIVDEIAGGADSAEVPQETIQRNFMVPVVQTYACSGVIVWDTATANGHLYQLRNLDYIMDAGLQDYPCIVVLTYPQFGACCRVMRSRNTSRASWKQACWCLMKW